MIYGIQFGKELWNLTLLAAVVLAPASAWAMNCSKAVTSTEKAICNNPEMQKQDDQMNRDYRDFIKHYSSSGLHDCYIEDQKKEQMDWMKKRNACGADVACIEFEYQERLLLLDALSSGCPGYDNDPAFKGRKCYEPSLSTPVTTPGTSPTAPTASAQSSKCEHISSASKAPIKEDKTMKKERQKTEREEILAYNRVYFVPSGSGLQSMALHEGIAHCLYNDQANLATIGIGHLIEPRGSIMQLPTKAPEKFEEYRHGISDEKIEDIKRSDIQGRVKDYADSRIKVKLNACQTDALISFFYNVGPSARVYELLNACDFSGVAAKMKEFNKVTVNGKKVVSAGLTKRREEEAAMFLHCQYPSGTPGVVPCCTYKLTGTFTDVSPGEYQAKCKKDCKTGESCYGI